MDTKTSREYREWLLKKIEQLTDWSQPMTAEEIPEGVEVIEVDDEPPGPDLDVYEGAAEIVREAGEYALLLGLHDVYETTRLRQRVFPQRPTPEQDVGMQPAVFALPVLSIEQAKILLGRCLAAANELTEDATPSTSSMPVELMLTQDEMAKLPQVKNMTRDEKQAYALGLLAKHPDWSLQQISTVVGVSRRTLYNWPRFRAANNMLKAKDTGAIPQGFKTSDGKVEAYSSVEETYSPSDVCAACGEPGAINEFKEKFYCRECYFEKIADDQEKEATRWR